MTGLLRLHRDPIMGGAHVVALPPWMLPSSRGVYWHMPRSACVYAEGRISVVLWCGQHRNVKSFDYFTEIPPTDSMCGTCIGRRQGYDRADGAIFMPDDHWALPRVCPGQGGYGWPSYCEGCGQRVRARNYPNYGEAPHSPLPELAERWVPCPRHGWRHIRTLYESGRMVCGSFNCGYVCERLGA